MKAVAYPSPLILTLYMLCCRSGWDPCRRGRASSWSHLLSNSLNYELYDFNKPSRERGRVLSETCCLSNSKDIDKSMISCTRFCVNGNFITWLLFCAIGQRIFTSSMVGTYVKHRDQNHSTSSFTAHQTHACLIQCSTKTEAEVALKASLCRLFPIIIICTYSENPQKSDVSPPFPSQFPIP